MKSQVRISTTRNLMNSPNSQILHYLPHLWDWSSLLLPIPPPPLKLPHHPEDSSLINKSITNFINAPCMQTRQVQKVKDFTGCLGKIKRIAYVAPNMNQHREMDHKIIMRTTYTSSQAINLLSICPSNIQNN